MQNERVQHTVPEAAGPAAGNLEASAHKSKGGPTSKQRRFGPSVVEIRQGVFDRLWADRWEVSDEASMPTLTNLIHALTSHQRNTTELQVTGPRGGGVFTIEK